MKYTGGCHCGAVRFEVEMTIDRVIACNCSICSKRGHLLSFTEDGNFKLLRGEDSLSTYLFGKKVIRHQFCKTCGTAPFARGEQPGGRLMRAINVRCLDEVDVDRFAVMRFDGKSL